MIRPVRGKGAFPGWGFDKLSLSGIRGDLSKPLRLSLSKPPAAQADSRTVHRQQSQPALG